MQTALELRAQCMTSDSVGVANVVEVEAVLAEVEPGCLLLAPLPPLHAQLVAHDAEHDACDADDTERWTRDQRHRGGGVA